jgi:hypothetical protein
MECRQEKETLLFNLDTQSVTHCYEEDSDVVAAFASPGTTAAVIHGCWSTCCMVARLVPSTVNI